MCTCKQTRFSFVRKEISLRIKDPPNNKLDPYKLRKLKY